MIGLSRCESVNGHARPLALEQLADAQLVRRVDDRPEQADGDRLGARAPRALAIASSDALLVERQEDVALRVDALADLEGQVARDVRAADTGSWRNGSSLPPSRSSRTSGKPSVVKKAVRAVRPSTIALVARVVPYVKTSVRASSSGTVRPSSGASWASAVVDALEGALEVGRRLRHVERARLVGDDDVRERAARVDGDAEPHESPPRQDYDPVGVTVSHSGPIQASTAAPDGS